MLASDLMKRQSYQVKTVLEKKGARKKTFLAFKDSLENPLSRSPMECSRNAASLVGICDFNELAFNCRLQVVLKELVLSSLSVSPTADWKAPQDTE